MEQKKFYLEKNSFCARSAVTCMILAIFFRLVGSIAHMEDRFFLIFQFLLPVVCCLLLIGCIRFFGKKHFAVSVVPVLLGVVFFILRIFTTDNIAGEQLPLVHIILCIVLYVAVLVLYILTLFGVIRTKWICVVLFGAPFLYHLIVEDYPAIRYEYATVSSAMLEFSVLFIILGLFFISLGLRTRVEANAEKSADIVPPIPGNRLEGPVPGGRPGKAPFEPKEGPGTEMPPEPPADPKRDAPADNRKPELPDEKQETEREILEADAEKPSEQTPAVPVPGEKESNDSAERPEGPSEAAPSAENGFEEPESKPAEGFDPNDYKATITPVESEDSGLGEKVGRLWDKIRAKKTDKD